LLVRDFQVLGLGIANQLDVTDHKVMQQTVTQ